MPKVNLATRINTYKPKFNKGAVKAWDKAYRKAQQVIKESGFSAKMISPLNRDLVEISQKKDFPPVDPYCPPPSRSCRYRHPAADAPERSPTPVRQK